LKVRDSGIHIVALRSATRKNIVSAQNSKSWDDIGNIKPLAYLESMCPKGGALSPADSKSAACLDSCGGKEKAGGEMADKCSTLPLIQRMPCGRDFGAEQTKSLNHTSATSTSLLTLSAVQPSQDRHAARKTASSVNSVTATLQTTGLNDTQMMRTVQSAGKVKMANDLHPVEV